MPATMVRGPKARGGGGSPPRGTSPGDATAPSGLRASPQGASVDRLRRPSTGAPTYLPVLQRVARRAALRSGERDPGTYLGAAFLGVMRAFRRYRVGRGASFHTFLWRCASSAVADVARSSWGRKGSAKRSARCVPMAGLALPAPTPDPAELAERRDLVAFALERLSPRERLALTLRYAEGRSWREVGRRLRLSESGALLLAKCAVAKARASGRRA